MLFEETTLAGAYLITLQPKEDERGFFARSFCKETFNKLGLHSDFVQCNISQNHAQGTLRGLHYQLFPYEEVKIVSCRKGKMFDVIVDMRENSPTYKHWLGVELSAINYQALYIPKGFAHGFQTLAPETEVFYLMGHYYYPNAARGLRWDDPTLAIKWPLPVSKISNSDQAFPWLNT